MSVGANFWWLLQQPVPGSLNEMDWAITNFVQIALAGFGNLAEQVWLY
jgi:hypothetical protein